jgi:hypothetical protein
MPATVKRTRSTKPNKGPVLLEGEGHWVRLAGGYVQGAPAEASGGRPGEDDWFDPSPDAGDQEHAQFMRAARKAVGLKDNEG